MTKNKLHKWEKKHKELCFINLQKNCPVENLATGEEDILFSRVRIYQADDVDKIIKVEIKKLEQRIKYLEGKQFYNIIFKQGYEKAKKEFEVQ